MYQTGYWAKPGTLAVGVTHIRRTAAEEPLCGVKIGNESEFQFCANTVHLPYVDCKRCLVTYEKQLVDDLERVRDKLGKK